jgi:Leucine rich repeat
LANNQLDSLDGNLFANNPELEYINLSSNQIRHLGPNIFNSLRNLRVLRMLNNICINEYADSAVRVADFRWRASFNCPTSFEQLEGEILNGQNFGEVVGSLVEQIQQLERRIEMLEGGHETTTT